ncbi:MAG: small multi-drug export protein [Coriobacteriia bacterium]|nr:small multi-drug export protein [Coriobacteriia bacterium]
MPAFVASLPPWLKYAVVTLIPWIELRGAVPMAIANGERAFLPLVLLANLAIFWPGYYFLESVYEHLPEGGWVHRRLEGVRAKARPLVERYGFVGLALFVAVPLPGTGAYSGTAAAWLLDLEPKRAFLAVSLGVVIAFAVVWASSELVAAGVRLL